MNDIHEIVKEIIDSTEPCVFIFQSELPAFFQEFAKYTLEVNTQYSITIDESGVWISKMTETFNQE